MLEHTHASKNIPFLIIRDQILQGHWTLVDIQVPEDALLDDADDDDHHSTSHHRYNVKAWFCDIDWNLHRDNPSSVSFFSGLKEQSKSCPSTLQQVDLFDLMQKVRAHDDDDGGNSSSNNNNNNKMRSIPLTGIVFHQSRCGSTLAANLLASFDPHKTRVYSEPSVTVKAIKACEAANDDTNYKNTCNHDLHNQLIRDVHYLLGRTAVDSGLEYIFIKSNSGGLYIDKFTSALPDTPWIYMFRDTFQVMQSHWKIPEGEKQPSSVKCARQYRNPIQPSTTLQVLETAAGGDKNNKRQYHELSRTEYCAAHLASISNAVLQEHQRTGKGTFVDYKQMPAVMWETVLPETFGVAVEPYMVDNMMQHTHLYSKGHQQGRENEPWASDTEQKESRISQSIKEAVQTFCPDTYDKLAKIALAQHQQSVHAQALALFASTTKAS